MFISGFLTGLIVALVVYGICRYIKIKLASPQEYEVASFSRNPNPDGTYDVNFFVGDAVKCGYTKKQIPFGFEPKDLKVILRSYHMTRGKYRVFWEVKVKKDLS